MLITSDAAASRRVNDVMTALNDVIVRCYWMTSRRPRMRWCHETRRRLTRFHDTLIHSDGDATVARRLWMRLKCASPYSRAVFILSCMLQYWIYCKWQHKNWHIYNSTEGLMFRWNAITARVYTEHRWNVSCNKVFCFNRSLNHSVMQYGW